MLRCRDGSMYCGWTNRLQRRLAVHSSGKGSKYVRSRLPFTLVYHEECEDRSHAMRREAEIKRMTRTQKWNLVSGNGNTPY